MPKFEVTISETISPGSTSEMKIKIEADNAEKAIEKAKPSWKAPYGRTYTVKELTGS